jgi:hypothetical protein
MRADIVPGAIFPDYELSDHTGEDASPSVPTAMEKPEAVKR